MPPEEHPWASPAGVYQQGRPRVTQKPRGREPPAGQVAYAGHQPAGQAGSPDTQPHTVPCPPGTGALPQSPGWGRQQLYLTRTEGPRRATAQRLAQDMSPPAAEGAGHGLPRSEAALGRSKAHGSPRLSPSSTPVRCGLALRSPAFLTPPARGEGLPTFTSARVDVFPGLIAATTP